MDTITRHLFQNPRPEQVCMVVVTMAIVYVFCSARPLALLRVTHTKPDLSVFMGGPRFVICTHSFEHIDTFVMGDEAKRIAHLTGLQMSFVMGDLPHNKLFCDIFHEQGCIAACGGTVARVTDALASKHVCMFLYDSVEATGAFYMARAATQDPVVVRIENPSVTPTIHVPGKVMSKPEMLMQLKKTCGQHYYVTYTEWRKPTATEEPKEYIAALRRELYEPRG